MCWLRSGGFVFLLVGCISCSQSPSTIVPAFYHWQTEFRVDSSEQDFLRQLSVQKLYVKFFDVDWDTHHREAVPLARVRAMRQVGDSLQIVPTVFITNRTLAHLSEKEIPQLSQKIYRQIIRLWPTLSDGSIREIQFDCDWNGSTREKFFALLRHFRQTAQPESCLLSATIRLHQIKYADRTGIPPVDRGMLMFYNMADLEAWHTPNSILDMEIADQYISSSTRYPLPLDFALPIFRWGALFRDGRMIKLINNLSEEELRDTSRFQLLSDHQYEVKQSTYLNGYYLYASDRLRLESVSSADLAKAAHLLTETFRPANFSVSLYHLDTATLKHYTHEELQDVFELFEQ